MNAVPQLSEEVIAAIGWFYLVTNSARVVTYLPQIAAVWRCRDGARAISLLTWGSWTVANLTAIVYGSLVVRDGYFVAISTINFSGCLAVTVLAALRRGLLGTHAARAPGTITLRSAPMPSDCGSTRSSPLPR